MATDSPKTFEEAWGRETGYTPGASGDDTRERGAAYWFRLGQRSIWHEVIAVAHLYELNGSMTGFGKTVGYYADREAAKEAGRALGHGYWEVEDVQAVRVASGEVYLLRQQEPVKLGEPGG